MANCIFVSNDDLERYSKELGISKLAVHATIMAMTEGKEVDSIPSPQEVKEYRQRNNIVAKATDNSLSEMASIKQKAIANGTFMKAPNGKPTNLTEGQWLQVRTKAFKDWFGDWELVANAEKLTDKDKHTLNRFFKVLPEYNSIFNGDVSLLNEYLKSIFPDSKYRKTPFLHMSSKKIDEFKIIPGRNLSDAIWFSGRRNYSAKVGHDVLNVALLNLKNPVIYDDSGAYVNTPDKYKERVTNLGYDSVIFEPTWEREDGAIGKNELDQIAVQNTDQIHILGTENDLKQARAFVDRFDASKVVDENGEPLVTYHTSPHSEFSSFDTRDRRIEINPDGSYDRSMMAFVYDMSDEEIDEAIRDYENNGGTSIYTAKSKGVSSSYAKTESQMFDIREREIIDNADSWAEQDGLAKEGLYDEAFAFARVRDQWTGEVDKSKEGVLRNRFGLSKEEFDAQLKEIDTYLESKTEKFTEANKFELFEDYVNEKTKSLRHNYSNDYDSGSDVIVGSQYALFVKMKNPLIVDAKGSNWDGIQYKGNIESTRTLEKIAKDNGYDGVIVKNVYDIGGEMISPESTDVFSVYNANSVKSATDNNGEFSRESDNIYYQTEKQLQSIESDTQKLKALNNRTLKSFGSESKLSDALKKLGVSPEIRGAILEGYKAMPSIRSLSPLAALQYIASSQYKGLVQQYNESIRKPQDEALEKRLTDYLSKYGFEINVGDAVKKFGSVTGVLDIINKIIYVANNRNEMTLPEEFGHAFVELLGSTTSKKEENKDFTFLMDTVENTELYKQVFEQYKDVYKREDGTPDTYKIKKEAIGQAIGLSILSQYKGQDNETKTFLQKVKEWVEKILNKFRGTEYLSFENLVNQMAKEVLEGSTKRLDKVDQTGYNRLDYYKTIEEQNKRDGGKALEFMKFFSSIGNVITGSLAYRLQGTVYRGKLDALHDIDMEVPQSAHGILMDSPLVANAIQQALNNNQEQLFDIVTNSPYFQKIKSKYPKIKFGAAYADRKKNDKITVNAVYSEDESLSERFLKMAGSYAERLNNFTEEERSQIYLFDFFLKPEATGFFEPVYELTLATFDVPMREKRWMGRAKDIMDYQNWRVFDEYRGKIQPTEQDLMYQIGDNDNMKFLNEITELTRDLNKRLGRGGSASVIINEYFNGKPVLKVFTYNSAFDLDYNYQIRYGLNGIIEVTSLPSTEQSKWAPFNRDESDLAAFKNFYQTVDKKSTQTGTSQVNREISIQERFFNNEFGGNFEGGGSFFEDFNGLRGDDLSKEDQMTLLEAVDRVEEIYMGGVDIPMSVDDLNTIFNYMKKVNPEAYKAAREDFKRRHPNLWKPVNNQTQQQNDIPASYEGKITPDANTIFVFGSNPEGRHGAGAAKVAREQFGAVYGQGEGLQGNAYALPTKDLRVKENNGLRSISPEQITESIKRMYDVARQNPNKQFKVAYTNGLNETTLNGYTGREMIQMFKDAGPIPSNVVFSKNWTDHWNEVQGQSSTRQQLQRPSSLSLAEESFGRVIIDEKDRPYIKEDVTIYDIFDDGEIEAETTIEDLLNTLSEVEAFKNKNYASLDDILNDFRKTYGITATPEDFEDKYGVTLRFRYTDTRQINLFEDSFQEKEEEPIVTSQELTTQRNALNAAYADNPAIKRDRVQSIARKFSKLLDDKYEQKRQRLLDAVKEAEDAGDDTKAASLYGEYATLTKQAFLRQYGVRNLFNDIRESYNPKNITPESELIEYLDLYGLDKDDLNDDDRSNIDWNYQHKRDEFKKVQDNFWPLAEEATLEIKKLERIIIDITSPNNTGKEEIKSSDTLNEDNSNSEDETNNVMDKEESAPESWMNNFRSIPNITSLSQRTREALMNLYEYDAEGIPVLSDLSEMKHLDPEHAHAILLFGLANMVNSDDFEPALIKLGKKYSFVRQLLREGENGKYEGILAEDPQLKAAFYQDFRKDATSYWSSRYKRDADGHYEKDTTFPLNSRENTSWLLASWKYNTEGGIQIGGQESVFNSDGTVNRNNLLKKVGPKLQSILDGIKPIKEDNQKISVFLDTINPTYEKSNWDVFMDVLHSIGIDQESDELRWALIDYKISEGQPVGIISVLNSISQITGGLNKDEKYYTPNAETGKIPAVDILTEFRGAYTAIADTIGYIGEGATEGSFYHMDKTRNSYTTPNYLGRVMKELSDANDDEKRCDNYIEENYGKFNWFKKDGVWLNSWLKQLAEKKELRKELKHKVVLDFNKKGFFETDSLGYALGLLREFNAPLVDKKKGYELAWYYVPMLSDTDSSEFIQFTKDTKEGYQDRLLNQMRLTVVQEYNRIKLVRERNQRIKEGKADKIANFDTRGLQFCFFPELNTWKDENGGFLEQLDSLTKQRAEAKEKGDETKRLELNTSIHNLIDRAVREIVEQDVDDTYNRFRELGVFDKDGTGTNAKFKYLKGYTDIDAQVQGNKSYIQETLNNLDRERYKNFTRLAEKYLANPYSLSYSDRQRLFAKASELRKESTPRVERNEHREMISKYVWNSRFATSQIEQIFATDLAYYKDATDFQKRFKEIHAPSLRLYTKAEYNGERVGKDIERSIYLADEKILSNTYEQLKQALDEREKNGTLSKASRDYILKQYENINSSDAQAYRTLDSYRAMLVMSGQWNDALEQAYKNFQSGNWTIEDFSQIFQTKKPYLYSQTGIDAQVSSGEQIKMGIQHKNSEFLLLAMLPRLVEGTSMQDAFKLRAIDQFMKENNIDVVNFTSAVKVGNQGIIDLNYKEGPVKYAGTEYKDAYALKKELDKQIEKGTINKERHDEILSQYKYKNEEEVLNHLRKITDNGKSTVTIHSASYEDYGIQTQTPEHIIDHEQLFGTQIRRLIGADITPGTILKVGNTKMTAEEWWKVYNGILVDNIAQAFDEVSEKFSTPEKIEKLLIETIKGNDRYPNDLVNAVRIVNGRFNIPLFDQSTAELVESLINSVIKDTVTKQKIKGGSCIQVSSFGLSDKLKVVYDTDEKGNTHVKYMECYMPAYAKEFYQAFMKKTDDGNYILDMKDFPEELRYAIGYRVPTEDKYSMAPLKIVGFLPQQNGSAIMLPAEITTLSGSDFDVDKMYIMLPEFDVVRYDKSKAIQDFKKFNQKYAQTQSWIDSIFGAIIDENFEGEEETDASADFDDWWKENKENYKLDKPKFRKIKGTFKADENGKNASFDDGLSKKENPSRADRERARKKRNNAIIDMMFSVLTNPDTLQRFVKPGGFAEVQKQAYIQRILENLSYNELCEALGVKGNVSEKLNSLDEDALKDLAGKYGKTLDPLSPLTQIHFHKQNSAGAKAIGIYAVNNAGQALLQHSMFGLDANDNPKALGVIKLFGKELRALNRVVNDEGEYITNNMAQYLAASVDNGKTPTLEDNGQNDFTFNVSNMLIRLGFRHREVAAIMNQPIIKELAAAVTKGLSDGVSKEITLNEVLTKYAKAAGLDESALNEFMDISGYTLEDMYKARCNGAEKNTEYYKMQFAIGLWFKNAEVDAMFVNTVTQNLRADAQNAAAGPTMIDTILREIKIETSITADRGLYDAVDTMSIDELKESPLGFIAAFQQFGIKRTQDILEEYFPQYSKQFKGMLTDLMDRTKYGNISVETAQKLFDAAILYNLQDIPIFSSLKGKSKSPEEVYKYFLKDFPETFKKAKESNPVVYKSGDTEVRFNDIPIIKGLKVVPASKNNVVKNIVLDTVGRLSKDCKAKLTQSLEALMYSGDDNARNLAINLFVYSVIRYSGKYTPTGFAHLVPTAVREGIKGYIDKLEDIRKHGVGVKDKGGSNSFRTLFLRNNTENRTLFPKLSDKEAKEIMKLFNDSKDLSGNGGRIITANTTALNDVIPSVVTVRMMQFDDKQVPVAMFKNGIMIQTKDDNGKTKKQFFIFNQISTTEAEMIPVTPLGAKGNISEYFLDNPYGESAVQVSQEYEAENTEVETTEEEPQAISAEIRYLNGSKKDDEGNDICVSISIKK